MSPFVKLMMMFLVASASQLADAYSRGAPEDACLNMEPQHGPSPQTIPAPFSVTPQQVSIEQGGTVKVLIEAKTARGSFQGFLFMAVDANDSPSSRALGRFINSPRQARSIDCLPGQSNALTHRDAKGKDKLEFTWVAPPDFQGEIQFRCTFLRDFTNFWVQVPSSTVVRVGSSANSKKSISSSSSMVPLVTVFDYFVWRIWFWTLDANLNA